MTETVNIDDYKLKLKYDEQISISTGKSRFEKNWKNKKTLWSSLVAKLKNPVRTAETYVEYKKMSRPEQDKIKDVGGYVGGHLKGGHRKSDNVMCRQLITLDLDFAPPDFFNVLEMLSDYACVCYSTHKHSSNTPRFRLLIPLDRGEDKPIKTHDHAMDAVRYFCYTILYNKKAVIKSKSKFGLH